MVSTKKTVLITGSTRGIGHAFAEHYAKTGWNVIGTARAESNTDKVRCYRGRQSPFSLATPTT